MTQTISKENQGEVMDVAKTTTMVAMRDGVRLATDVYLPAAPGPFPVLLERTPYGRNAETRRERSARHPEPLRRGEVAAQFARHGYAVVVQDCRGRFDSEGRFTKYLGEANDGADTLAWLASQPWCDGQVGTYGLSYAAHTQTALASQRPAGLAAMFLECGGFANAYRGGIRHGGAFELKQATWAYRNALQAGQAGHAGRDGLALQALASEDIATWFAALPWQRGHSPLKWVPEYEDYLFEQWERGSFDDYWRQPELYAAGHYDSFDGIPVLLMCGWWDPYAQTTADNYLGISRREKGIARMVLGPWTHGERSVTHAGDVDFGPQAQLDGVLADDYVQMRLAWFGRWLRGPAAQSMGETRDDPAVRYFRMGGGSGTRTAQGRLDHGGCWLSAGDWPVPGTQFVPWYLHADGSLDDVAPGSGEQSGVLEYEFDPSNPVPTIGGSITSGEPLMTAGAFDQRTHEGIFGARSPHGPLAEREDVLVFRSEPLAQDLEVTGPVLIKLWISSSAPDTDFTAKLIDLYPPSADYPQGYAMNVTDGILRCRYRKSWENPEMLSCGEIAEITIEPMPTSNLFKKGHRIRLDISSSNFPRFDVNPNTGAPEGSAGPRVKARNRIHMEASRRSHLLLPVM
ncbi:MAG TPA: CocE/NonD family hydrolase, partial [Burkholderiaceae bacterium]|nr:CocE/NonD family hydrolase [Burkholderiaceae bacterium]